MELGKNIKKKNDEASGIAAVGRSMYEIKNRIKEIKKERQELLQNYLKSNDEKERDIISLIATEKALTIKELQWVLGL